MTFLKLLVSVLALPVLLAKNFVRENTAFLARGFRVRFAFQFNEIWV